MLGGRRIARYGAIQAPCQDLRWTALESPDFFTGLLDGSYTETIIARRKRDYAWIMTRDAEIESERYQELVERLVAMGYDRAKIRRVPQRWPDRLPGAVSREVPASTRVSTPSAEQQE